MSFQTIEYIVLGVLVLIAAPCLIGLAGNKLFINPSVDDSPTGMLWSDGWVYAFATAFVILIVVLVLFLCYELGKLIAA